MRSRTTPIRDRQAGFTFLEILISLALTAVVVGSVMVVFSRAATTQAERLHRLWLAEFAVSVLEEYRVTYPEMSPAGAAPGGWHWQIAESALVPQPSGSLDAEITYVSVSIRVWQEARPDQDHATSTLMTWQK